MAAFNDADEALNLTTEEREGMVFTPYPLFWEMTRRCIGFDGKFLHFPRGTYTKQVATAQGRLELDLMEMLWSTMQTLNRWSKGLEHYKSAHAARYLVPDQERIKALTEWQADQKSKS